MTPPISTTCFPDLVQGTRLTTHFQGHLTVHHFDDSDDEDDSRPTKREEFWENKELLGEGGGGSVYLQTCVHGKRKHEARAVKFLRTSNWQAEYLSELVAIARFSQKRYSKCFVKMLGWYEANDMLCIAMEHLPLGDLQRYTDKEGAIAEPNVQAVIRQVLEGLDFMHRENFAHRDIKPSNILIKSQPPKQWWVKISDFGISKRLATSMVLLSKSKGTMLYMAPELPMEDPKEPLQIDYRAADLWSMGIMVFYLLTQTFPFPTHASLACYLSRPDVFPSQGLRIRDASTEAEGFIRALVKGSPGERLSSGGALDHEWLQSPGSPKLGSNLFLPTSQSSQVEPVASNQPILVPDQEPGLDPWATLSSGFSSQAFTPSESENHHTKDSAPEEDSTNQPTLSEAQMTLSPSTSSQDPATKSTSPLPIRASSGCSRKQNQIINANSTKKRPQSGPPITSQPSSPLGPTPVSQPTSTTSRRPLSVNQPTADVRTTRRASTPRSNIIATIPPAEMFTSAGRLARMSSNAMVNGRITFITPSPANGWDLGRKWSNILMKMDDPWYAYFRQRSSSAFLIYRITQLQEEALRFMLRNPPRNVVVSAQPGTGKTIAAILAVILQISPMGPGSVNSSTTESIFARIWSSSQTPESSNRSLSPEVLCLVPDTNLADHLKDTIMSIVAMDRSDIWMPTVVSSPDLTSVKQSRIMIGTPELILSCFESSSINFGRLFILLIDEADRVLTDVAFQRLKRKLRGFHGQVLVLTTLDFSRLKEHIDDIAPEALLADYGCQYTVVQRVTQMYIDARHMDSTQKFNAIHDLRRIHWPGQLVIFVQSSLTARALYNNMVYDWGIVVKDRVKTLLHSHTYYERSECFEQFKTGRLRILITTVEIQGIHSEFVTMIVNYDLPVVNSKGDADLYLRRVGVAGGLNGRGICINFAHDMESFDMLEEFTRTFQVSTFQLDLTDLGKAKDLIHMKTREAEHR